MKGLALVPLAVVFTAVALLAAVLLIVSAWGDEQALAGRRLLVGIVGGIAFVTGTTTLVEVMNQRLEVLRRPRQISEETAERIVSLLKPFTRGRRRATGRTQLSTGA